MNHTLTTFKDITDSIDKYHSNPQSYKGLSTGSPKLDEYLTLRAGNLHVVTGIPSSGKSEVMDQIMLNTIALHEWHWTVFSPENWPLEAHFMKLCEKYTGKPWTKQGHLDGINKEEVADALEIMSQSIAFADVPQGMMTVDKLIGACEESHKLNTTDALLLDPWNELEAQLGKTQSETNMIGESLSKLRNFGRKHKIAIFVVAHPTKLQKNQETGNYPVPTPYDISGSAHWRNKADVCLSVWRDYSLNDGVVQIHVQKIRNKMLGRLGMVELHWMWSNGLFLEEKRELSEGETFAIKKRVV